MPTALGDLSFAFFLAPLANQRSHPANELAGYGCTVLTALKERLIQYRQNNFLDYYQSTSIKVRVVDGSHFAHGFIHGIGNGNWNGFIHGIEWAHGNRNGNWQ